MNMETNILIKVVLMGLALFFSLVVVCVSSPIYGVLALIALFIITSFLFLVNNVEFLAFIYLLVYVGALLILFLWVVLTIPIKKKVFIHLRLMIFGILTSCVIVLLIFLVDFSSIKFVSVPPDSPLFSLFVKYLKNNIEFQFFGKFSESSKSFLNLSKLIPPVIIKQIHAVEINHVNFLYNIYVIYSAKYFVLLSPITFDSPIGSQLFSAYMMSCRVNHVIKNIYNVQLFLHMLSSLNNNSQYAYIFDFVNNNMQSVLVIALKSNVVDRLSLILPPFVDLTQYMFAKPKIVQNVLYDSMGFKDSFNFFLFNPELVVSPYTKTFINLAFKLYQNFAFCLFITGLILLAAMVGAVELVKFQKSESRRQNTLLQLQRSESL